ncbi:phage tail sheath subtilisin-like domain-containing protein [Pseudoroseomonas cervicalis]|uniref:Bacteriophage Mu tail sheath protein (GpL) n=1 Tax=Pseudoroseomonas cervicalis ATCC 49957 TaxID=525371 RepID=D5RTF8_9PROT|nr:phage tail sheath subtilisin-like domain-containing protein [Pseudoroseomonas cervicalis]EFH09389.1 bacteriophage Mu tail sheath protein (GpL) [Pseudoroseomonas cervicalis ATCC 49957]
MAIGFREIPSNLRVPLFFAELDNSRANSAQEAQRSLIIGQMLGSGTLAAGVPVLMQGVDWVKQRAGAGSMLAQMAECYRKRDGFGEVWLLPLADAVAGVAATGSVALSGSPTAAGTLSLYIGGMRVQQLVTTGQTAAQIATALAATINGTADLAVTAAAASSTVTLTARHKGLTGNDLPLVLNYRGAPGGEVTPDGLTVTFTAMSGGTTNPVLDTALANLGDMPFDYIAMPYTDTTSLDALKSFLASRWAWDRMLYGGAFAAVRGTLGQAGAFGLARNDAHVSVMPCDGSPTPPWCWAANLTGALAVSLRADVALPLHGLGLDVLAPPPEKRWTIGERNTLLWSGLSSHTVQDDGTVTTETIVTTYQRNPLGAADDSYLYVERLYTLAAVIRNLRIFVTSTFGRMKLASNDQPVRPGQNIVTPNLIRNAIIGRYRELERLGLVQNSAAFEASLVVERNGTNRCRIDALLPIVPIDQLRQLAALVQFRNSQG